jgi:predicted membrane protein
MLDTTIHKRSFVCLCLFSCVWWCLIHIVLCFLFYLSLSFLLCMVVSNTYCVVLWFCLSLSFLLCMVVSNTYCVVFFVLFVFVFSLVTTIHKRKDEDKQNKKHNTICVRLHYTQEKKQRQTNQKTHIVLCFLFCLSLSFLLCIVVSNTYCVVLWFCLSSSFLTICVRHHYTQEKRQRQTKQKTQHNMCLTPLYTREKMKTNKTKNTTQYVLDITIHTYCVVFFVLFVFIFSLVYGGV